MKNYIQINDIVEDTQVNVSLLQNINYFKSGEYVTVQNKSLTEVIEIMESNRQSIMRVAFYKKPTQEQIIEKLDSLYANKKGFMSKTDFDLRAKVIAKHIHEGEFRVMDCLLTERQKLGRLLVTELESSEYKQIDTRTIEYVILKNIKYVVKK